MANDFSTGKSIFVLAIVAGCFAILWPNVFYPMIQGSNSQKDLLSSAQGCCDVMFDSDVNAIKVMIEICEKILLRRGDIDSKIMFAFQQGKLSKDIISQCQKTVFGSCGVDITQFLMDKVRLGRTYKQMLDEIRSHNSSLCLKQSFGASLGEIGLPRRIRVWGLNQPKHLKQERPPHLRPEFLHPALREKGRAIPHTHIVPKVSIQESRTTPMPGIRPPMGGPGQVVPPPKTTSGTMGVVMPMYTIGIIVFFLYTMMKLLFKKSDASESLECFMPDPDFHKTVFNEKNHSCIQDVTEEGTKIGWRERDTIVSAISGLVEEVNRQIRSDQALHSSIEKESETLVQSSAKSIPPESLACEDEIKETEKCDDGKSVVKVLGMEMTESCEHGGKWSRPPTPLSRPSTPQNIFISGSLPSKSQLLVSDSLIETIPAQDDAVVLTGKVTLSLIGYSENNTDMLENITCVSHCESESEEITSKETALDNGTEGLDGTKETRLIETNGHCCETGDLKDFSEKKEKNEMTSHDKLNIKSYNIREDSKED